MVPSWILVQEPTVIGLTSPLSTQLNHTPEFSEIVTSPAIIAPGAINELLSILGLIPLNFMIFGIKVKTINKKIFYKIKR
jgi:hypothetical protein